MSEYVFGHYIHLEKRLDKMRYAFLYFNELISKEEKYLEKMRWKSKR